MLDTGLYRIEGKLIDIHQAYLYSLNSLFCLKLCLQDVLNMFFNEELEPNTETFGLLSYSCTTMDEIYDFLDVLKEHSYK